MINPYRKNITIIKCILSKIVCKLFFKILPLDFYLDILYDPFSLVALTAIFNRLLLKLAAVKQVQRVYGAQKRSVHEVHEHRSDAAIAHWSKVSKEV